MMATDGIERQDNGDVEVSFGGIRHYVRTSEIVPLATLGFGFLENAILNSRSRYSCDSQTLREEIQGCLEPSAHSATGFRDPKTGRLEALTETLAQAVQETDTSGVALLHSMRRLTTQTYNYDEFLGDRRSAYIHTNVGERLAQRGLEYRYIPLLNSGPPTSLRAMLNDETFGWKDFVREYHTFLDAPALGEVTVQVLAAASQALLPVLFCCEPYVACFDALAARERKEYGCHRFLLCARVHQSLDSASVKLQVLHLNPSKVRRAMCPKAS